MIDWELPVGGMGVVARVAAVTPRTLALMVDRGYLATVGSGSGPKQQRTGIDTASAIFQRTAMRGGLLAHEAFLVWKDLGHSILSRRIYPEPGEENDLAISLAIWRQTDGDIGAVLFHRGIPVHPDSMERMHDAERHGEPVLQIDIDALLDFIETRIREFAPGCPAVQFAPRGLPRSTAPTVVSIN